MECPVGPRPHTVGGPAPRGVPVKSEFIAQLLQEIENEARGPVPKPRPPQKDHMRENVRRLRDIQAHSRQRQLEAEEKRKQLQQPLPLKAHRAAAAQATKPTEPRDQPPKTAGPMRSQTSLTNGRGSSLCKSLPQLPQTEQACDVPCPAIGMGSARSDSGSDASAACCSKKKSKSSVKHRPGQIPNYLTERKRQWELERERELKLQEESAVPEGYTLLPDEERLETLDLLKINRDELIQSLSSLPVRNDTQRLRSHKEELERQLAKVEEGIKIFSRPKVLIRHDDT